MINFTNRDVRIIAKEVFAKINEERMLNRIPPFSGAWVVVRKVNTSHKILVKVGLALVDVLYDAIYKTTKTEVEGWMSSQQYSPGCIAYCPDHNSQYHVSVAGLNDKENVFMAIMIMAKVCEISSQEVVHQLCDGVSWETNLPLLLKTGMGIEI